MNYWKGVYCAIIGVFVGALVYGMVKYWGKLDAETEVVVGGLVICVVIVLAFIGSQVYNDHVEDSF